MEFHEYLKTLPKHEQKRFWRGNRLFKYIIKQRCQQPEMLAGDDAGESVPAGRGGAGATPKVRGGVGVGEAKVRVVAGK